jgi:flagellar protein FlaG
MITSTAISGARPELPEAALKLPRVAAEAPQQPAPVAPRTVVAAPRVAHDPVKLQENLREAVDQLNKQLASSGRSLGFSFDDVLNAPVVTVKSTATGEVIRQIPSEAVLRVAHTFEALKGMLHDATT